MNRLTETVKHLLIVNVLFFIATSIYGDTMYEWFALWFPKNENFELWQIITHMFMHANFTHLFFNMFTLWMFGKTLENKWGAKRFLTYYLITGFGAALIYVGYIQFQINTISSNIDLETYNTIINKGNDLLNNNQNFIDPLFGKLNSLVNIPMLGASGAVYGLLLAFGIIFPNSIIYLYMAIPIKTKYFVAGIGCLALFNGIGNNPGDNVAHFAHLGGMIFGIILLKYWKKKGEIWF